MHAIAQVDCFKSRFGPEQAPVGEFRLPVARLELVFRCRDVCWLPPARGALWRSVLGPQFKSLTDGIAQSSALRRIQHRYVSERRAAACPMPPDLYAWLFRTSPNHCLALPSFGTAPHPLTIDCPAAKDWEFVPPGNTMRLQITLAGRLIHAWQSLLLAFANAAGTGIGKATSLDGRRGRAELVSAYQVWRGDGRRDLPVYVSGEGFKRRHLEVCVPEPPTASPVQIALVSPLRLERRKKVIGASELRAGDLLSALSRRAGALMAGETGRRPDFDFTELKAQWDNLQMYCAELNWTPQQRWSAAQERQLPLDGITGSFILDLTGQQLLFDLLWLGQWIGAGKGTMMGLGAIRLQPVIGNPDGKNA